MPLPCLDHGYPLNPLITRHLRPLFAPTRGCAPTTPRDTNRVSITTCVQSMSLNIASSVQTLSFKTFKQSLLCKSLCVKAFLRGFLLKLLFYLSFALAKQNLARSKRLPQLFARSLAQSSRAAQSMTSSASSDRTRITSPSDIPLSLPASSVPQIAMGVIIVMSRLSR